MDFRRWGWGSRHIFKVFFLCKNKCRKLHLFLWLWEWKVQIQVQYSLYCSRWWWGMHDDTWWSRWYISMMILMLTTFFPSDQIPICSRGVWESLYFREGGCDTAPGNNSESTLGVNKWPVHETVNVLGRPSSRNENFSKEKVFWYVTLPCGTWMKYNGELCIL